MYTDSFGALRRSEICTLEDAASFELAIEKWMFGKVPHAFYIVNTLLNNNFFAAHSGIILIFWVRIQIFETLFRDIPDKGESRLL